MLNSRSLRAYQRVLPALLIVCLKLAEFPVLQLIHFDWSKLSLFSIVSSIEAILLDQSCVWLDFLNFDTDEPTGRKEIFAKDHPY